MWSLLPIILTIFHTVASRTEPVDFSKHNRHNEVLIPSESLGQPKELNDLKLLAPRLKGAEFDEINELPVWSKFDKYEPQMINLVKNSPLSEIDANVFDQLDDSIPENYEEVELSQLSSYLATLLRQPAWNTPLVIVEEPTEDFPDDEVEARPIWKRAKSYYRRYTGKRQNGRSRNSYDYDSPYLCTPSREDVFQLLVALHDVRQGNKSRTVNFCNRRRPVSTVFTNIRFLGRRK